MIINDDSMVAIKVTKKKFSCCTNITVYKIANGKPEYILGGVDIPTANIDEVIKLLGYSNECKI